MSVGTKAIFLNPQTVALKAGGSLFVEW